MKTNKILSLIAALALTAGTSTTAVLADTSTIAKSAASVENTYTLKKVYTDLDGEELPTGVYPVETLTFGVIPGDNNPDNTTVTVEDVTTSGQSSDVTVSVPAYTKVGKWTYTVAEIDPNTDDDETTVPTQGVTYDTNGLNITVLVTKENGSLTKQVYLTNEDGKTKTDSITNKYDINSGSGDSAALNVKKYVTGNLASDTQKFDITVSFTSPKKVTSTITGAENMTWTYDETAQVWKASKKISLSDYTSDNSQSYSFTNIPVGVTYSVSEDSKYQESDASMADPKKGYDKPEYENATGTIAKNSAFKATVTNNKGEEVETGILTDSTPYIAMVGIVAVIAVAFIARKRKVEE